MKLAKNSDTIDDHDDATLVLQSMSGNPKAFELIVNRYQRLLCSIAYSSLGNLSESEDVAQEAFVEAWKKLGNLREPEKLKSWLCSILRFKVSHHLRKGSRQPLNQANDLSSSEELESAETPIEESTMRDEEQALLWQALESVPDTYRETLILYYREHRSVEHVAFELDLTEDAVKQRLSRGRKVLQEKMMSFVEGALERTAPKRTFTAAVIAATIGVSPSAKAAGAGVTAAKMGSTFSWATLTSFLMPLSSLLSPFIALRANLAQSRTQVERRAVFKTVATFVGVSIAFVAVMFGLRQFAARPTGHEELLAIVSQLLVISFVIGYLMMTFGLLRKMRSLRTAEKLRRPDLFESLEEQKITGKREYRSRFTFLGLPLIHAKLGMAEVGEKPAMGWIAAGHKAYGILFAWGGIAVAPISVGIISIGLVSAGVVGFGVMALGVVGIGIFALGESAIGFKAYASSSALGWESAFSQGFSIAKDAAIGPIAFASEINNELAHSIANLSTMTQSYPLIFGIMAILIIVPVIWWSHLVKKNMH